MTNEGDTTAQPDPPEVTFTLPPRGASKRPEQLAALLENTLRREFPAAAKLLEIACLPDGATVALRNLDQLDEEVARKITRRADVVRNEFLISPWY
ncbi:MAG: hypothetical protein F4057_04125 [Acidobacteria bacterium]|nr:hypothetical protein [Acidobacteriota bacterium]